MNRSKSTSTRPSRIVSYRRPSWLKISFVEMRLRQATHEGRVTSLADAATKSIPEDEVMVEIDPR